MAEYYTVLKRAVGGLDPNVADARRAVYDKARNALIGQLKAVEPPLTTAEISRQRLELEEAIRRVERETAAGVVGAAAALPGRAPQAPAIPPPARLAPPAPAAAASQPSPQDVFRRAMQEAGVRGAEAGARMERLPVRGRDVEPPPRTRVGNRPPPEPPYHPEPAYRAEPTYPQEPAHRPEPAYAPEPDYRREPQYVRQPAYEPPRDFPTARGGEPPRLAPDYDQDWDRAAPPPPPGPAVDRRDRPATVKVKGRRRGYLEEQEQDDGFEREPRRSRLPAIFLFVLIVGMVGGLGALAWSQRAVISDLLASFDSGGTADAPAAPTPVADAASAKNADRLLEGGEAPAPSKDVRVVSPDDDAAADESTVAAGSAADAAAGAVPVPPLPSPPPAAGVASGDALVAQKAILYEEPRDGAANGVTAINAAVTWRFIENGPNGPEIEASLQVPERGMKIRFSLHRNTDDTLPASHLVEVVVDTPADFPGKAVSSVPRIVLKPTEEARGQPLVGAAAKVADGFFWIALSAADADVVGNLQLISERNWIDLPLVYDTGQRAILTFEKGTPGDRVLQKALAAWDAG